MRIIPCGVVHHHHLPRAQTPVVRRRWRTWLLLGAAILALAVITAGCTIAAPVTPAPGATASPQEAPSPTPAPSDTVHASAATVTETLAAAMLAARGHSESLHAYPAPFDDMTIEIWFTKTEIDPDEIWTYDPVTNTGGTFRALITCNPDLCQDRLLIKDLEAGQLYEVGFSTRMLWRPLSGLVWLDDSILLFEQWSQPRHGYQFAVDVPARDLALHIVLSELETDN